MTKIRRLHAYAFIGLGLMLTSTAAVGAVNDPGDFQAPAVPALGPETIQVIARVAAVLMSSFSTGPVVATTSCSMAAVFRSSLP